MLVFPLTVPVAILSSRYTHPGLVDVAVGFRSNKHCLKFSKVRKKIVYSQGSDDKIQMVIGFAIKFVIIGIVFLKIAGEIILNLWWLFGEVKMP